MLERQRAWDDLERESEEVKRKIRSHMRMQPESLVIENPMLANRVSQQYEPKKFEKEFCSTGDAKMREALRKSEGNPMPTQSSHESIPKHRDSSNDTTSKRKWTTDQATKKEGTPKKSHDKASSGGSSKPNSHRDSKKAAENRYEEPLSSKNAAPAAAKEEEKKSDPYNPSFGSTAKPAFGGSKTKPGGFNMFAKRDTGASKPVEPTPAA
jgi:hypothetical protein